MKRYLLLLVVFLLFSKIVFSQSATFITLSSGGQLAQVTVAAGGCTSTPLNFCNVTTGTPLSIALNGNVLYVVDNKGFLYSSILNSSGSCTYLGQFLSGSTKMYGLTVDKNGKVYAANGTQIESFDPKQAAGNQFEIVGNVPASFSIGGDLLFYAGQLYMACSNGALLAIDTLNPANSTTFLNFTSPSVFGFASVTVPCSNNQAFALSNASSTTNIIGVDMQNKVETGTICTLNYRINDAASVAETQSAVPTTTIPLSFSGCNQVNYLGKIYTSITTVKDTVKSVQGCDSIYHNVTITINKPTSSTTTVNTTTAYIWNGTTYTTSGTYTKTGLTNSVGCDSTATLIFTIRNNPCWKMISAGYYHTVAIKIDGTLWAWGRNIEGQLGDGVNVSINIPKQIGNANNWASINAGFFHTVAIKTDGTLWAWGENNFGQLGNGTNINKNMPTPIGIDNDWSSVRGGYSYTLAIKLDGTLWAWGFNGYGELGDGTLTHKNIPVKIGIAKDWASISTGSTHTLAIKTDGTLWTWGENNFGQLGNGTNVSKNMPLPISTVDNLVDISAGYNHTVAFKKDGTLWTCGLNSAGQLGDGTTNDKNVPTTIGAINSWINMDAGGTHTLATKIDGTLWAWGSNFFGELGDGTNINKNIPIQIGTANNWADISAGENHSIVIKVDGSLWAWGNNMYGQLGDGTNIDKNTPKVVINSCCPTTKIDTLNLTSCSSITYKTKTYTTSTSFTDTTKSYKGCDSVYTLVNIVITVTIKKDTLNQLKACNQLVYKNNTYTSSALILDSIIKTVAGSCDSIYHYAQITITPVTPVNNPINLSSCKPILYNNQTYSTSTIIKDTVKSFQGCDSIYNVVNININPITATSNTQTLTSCKAIVYSGSTYNASTVIEDTIKNYQGCDSIYNVVNININPINPKVISNTLNSCKPIIYNGSTYNTTTILHDTIKSFQGCDSIYNVVNININSINTTTKTLNFTGCGFVNYNSIVYTSSTTYIDTLKTILGCDSIYTTTNITVYPNPVINANDNIYILENTPTTLKPIFSNAANVTWYPTKYLSNGKAKNPICTPLADQTYLITATSNNGCVDTSSLRVFIIKSVTIPSAFSPNGDGINDTWVIDNLNTYPQSKVQVYDRWGQLLFSSSLGNYKPWDGKFNGKSLPVGVYYYTVSFAASKHIMTGSLTLLR